MSVTPTVWLTPDHIFAPPASLQADPSTAAIGFGRSVVVWTDAESSYGDGTGQNIVGVILDAEGQPISSAPFQIGYSGVTGSIDSEAVVASRPGGGFGVVYLNSYSGNQTAIVVDFFDASGNHDTVNSRVIQADDADDFSRPSIAMRSDGSYVVTYLRHQAVGDGTYDVVARMVSKTGVVGSELPIFDSTDTTETSVETAALSNGKYVVAYEHYAGLGDSDPEVRLISKDGTLGAVIQPSISGDAETDLQVAALKGGGFVVAWTSDSGGGTDIKYSVYANNGGAIKTQVGGFLANTTTTGGQDEPDVVALKDGGFVVLWRSAGSIWGQRFDHKGEMVGSEFDAHGGGNEAAGALLDDGRFAVASHEAIGGPANFNVFDGIFDPRGKTINGTNGRDYLTAPLLDGKVNGLGGNDFLYGHSNADRLDGGAGRDFLFGNEGKDTLIGGTGADAFVFRSIFDSNPGNGHDTIQGFSHSEHDKIDISDLADSIIGDPGFVFIGKQSFADYNAGHTNQYGMVRFANGLLQVNLDPDFGIDLEVKVTGSAVGISDLILLDL